MFKTDRLAIPQLGMRLVLVAEDLARRHGRAPLDFSFFVDPATTIPERSNRVPKT
jgi:hypothetical protein